LRNCQATSEQKLAENQKCAFERKLLSNSNRICFYIFYVFFWGSESSQNLIDSEEKRNNDRGQTEKGQS